MVDQGKQDENREELNLEQQLDQANNTPKMTVISAKVYQRDKAEFIKNADEYGRTAAGQIAYLIRKFNRGELSTPDMTAEEEDNYKEMTEHLQSLVKSYYSEIEELNGSLEQANRTSTYWRNAYEDLKADYNILLRELGQYKNDDQ
jgi:ribosome recycling factor